MQANWEISLDDLKNIANGNLAKHPIPMQPFITLNGTWIYVLDTAQDAIPSYLSSCIFQSSFQYAVYEALNKKPYYILPLSGSAIYVIPVLDEAWILKPSLYEIAERIRSSEYAYPDFWLNHFYIFNGDELILLS